MHVVGTETNAEIDQKEKEKSYLFNIKEKDKLLWAFYIMLNGEDAYKYLKTKFVADKEVRIKSVEKLHKMSNVFKHHKLNKGRIEAELSSDALLTLEGFFGLCVIHNLSALFIKRNCYCELYGVGDSDNPYLIEEFENGIGIHVFKNKESSAEVARDVRKTKWKMENILAPIKSISSYTLSELLEIYNKVMSMSTEPKESKQQQHVKEKKTKQYLYDYICKQFI
uniref:Uncharacterized protein n=1 Tax=viral metagenome TaxID=1070528 RepID=A0A6C0I1V6_9ZZZZ